MDEAQTEIYPSLSFSLCWRYQGGLYGVRILQQRLSNLYRNLEGYKYRHALGTHSSLLHMELNALLLLMLKTHAIYHSCINICSWTKSRSTYRTPFLVHRPGESVKAWRTGRELITQFLVGNVTRIHTVQNYCDNFKKILDINYGQTWVLLGICSSL